jgi:excisionase family DNA binding protein
MLSGHVRRLSNMAHVSDGRISAQEVADRLGVAEKTVRRWIECGKLDAARHGKTFAIDFSEAEAVFAQSRSGRGAGRQSEAEIRAADAEAALLEFKGRYAELREHVVRLEHELATERRRAAAFEVRAQLRTT